jgi:hypothetical protein
MPWSLAGVRSKKVRVPLCAAVWWCPSFADALMELGPRFGLDVSWINRVELVNKADDGAAAIGFTNLSFATDAGAAKLFEQLLLRTDRNVVTGGHVYIDRGCEQSVCPTTHILIANILRCHYYWSNIAQGSKDQAQRFIAHALRDGGGADLTGGVPHTSVHLSQCLSPHLLHIAEIWPQGTFGGALVLLDTLCKWWDASTQRSKSLSSRPPLLEIRQDMVAALRRIRDYRAAIQPALAVPLDAGNIHARDLGLLIVTYVLVPLHDETQLNHPLLLPTP